jgi:thiol-disulfide isomerase/thioredoxin
MASTATTSPGCRWTVRLALCGALLPAVAAEPPERNPRIFLPTLAYVLRVDDQPAPAGKFYRSERDDAYLILSSRLPGPVLLELRSKQVVLLATAPPARADGALALAEVDARKPQGVFEVRDGAPSFAVEGKQVRLAYPPPLLGLQSAAALRSYNPEYGRRAAAYQPDAAALARLAASTRPVRLRIYFGTWCPTCTRELPNLMKVLDSLDGAGFAVEYYGLPEERGADPEPARMKLQGLPTAIVYRQGQEAGRITGKQWQQPEVALREILAP